MAALVSGGYVAAGYEKVREQFMVHFEHDLEHCAQVCAFVRGRKVVDLWAAREHRANPGQALHGYGPAGLQNIFSSSKVITSLVVAMLVDRGLLHYDQLVSDIWPEYAQNGKGATTIVMLMRHEAGLREFDAPMEANELTAERIRAGSVSDFIARQKPKHKPGSRRMYHGLTRGWIINEVVRRVDPQGRTVGQFLHDEIVVPLGLEGELAIGLPDTLHASVAPLHGRGKRYALSEFVRPGTKVAGVDNVLIRVGMSVALGAIATAEFLGLSRNDFLTVNGGRESGSRRRPKDPLFLFNRPEVQRAEIPSANGHASAHALALVAAVLAEGGSLPPGADERCPDGCTLLSSEGFAEATARPDHKRMFGLDFVFTNAGWCDFRQMREGFMGWMGLGGSVMQWHPQERIGFGYAMNLMEPIPWNARALRLQGLVRECARGAPDVPLASRL